MLMQYLQKPDEPEANTVEQASPSVVIAPEVGQSVVSETEPLVAEQAEQVVQPTASVKPSSLSWMSDEDYNEQLRYVSPEQLEKVYSAFDPNSAQPFYQSLFQKTQRKPTVPDERRIKAANTIAGVTDALSLLVQGITGANKGLISQQGQSAIKNNADYIQRLRELYRRESDRYNAGLFDSTVKDIEAARQGHNMERTSILNVLNNGRKLRNAKDIAEAKNAHDLQKFNANLNRQNAALEETRRHNQEMERISGRNADANALRASKYKPGTSNSSSDNAKKGVLEFFDPNTGSTFRVNEKKFNANAPQMFNLLLDDILASDEKLAKQYRRSKGKISLPEQNDAVKKYMLQNPDAVKFLEKISDEVVDDSSLMEVPQMTDDQIGQLEQIANTHKGNDSESLRQMASYLKSQGYSQVQIKNILKAVQ